MRRGLFLGLRSALIAGALGAPLFVQAQLFSDDQARKAVLDLRAKVSALEGVIKEQGDDVQSLRKAMLDLNSQLEQLRAELSRMRGASEQLVRELSELQRQQKDIAQGVEDRVRKLEPVKVSMEGREFLADPQEKRQYEEALAQLRGGDFAAAARSFSAFMRRYPSSGFSDSASFWLGNALYGKREYKDAIAAFRVTAASEHPQASEALLAVANCQIEMKEIKAARLTLAEVIKQYPQSESAKAAKERLASLPRS